MRSWGSQEQKKDFKGWKGLGLPGRWGLGADPGVRVSMTMTRQRRGARSRGRVPERRRHRSRCRRDGPVRRRGEHRPRRGQCQGPSPGGGEQGPVFVCYRRESRWCGQKGRQCFEVKSLGGPTPLEDLRSSGRSGEKPAAGAGRGVRVWEV